MPVCEMFAVHTHLLQVYETIAAVLDTPPLPHQVTAEITLE